MLEPSQSPSIETEVILIGKKIFKNRTGTFIPCPTPALPWLSGRLCILNVLFYFLSSSCLVCVGTWNWKFSLQLLRAGSHMLQSREEAITHLPQMYTHLQAARSFPVPWGTEPETGGITDVLGPWTSRGLSSKTWCHCKRTLCPALDRAEQRNKPHLGHGAALSLPPSGTSGMGIIYSICGGGLSVLVLAYYK